MQRSGNSSKQNNYDTNEQICANMKTLTHQNPTVSFGVCLHAKKLLPHMYAQCVAIGRVAALIADAFSCGYDGILTALLDKNMLATWK
jgi:hypothetical protein